jgi:hypothetical protein
VEELARQIEILAGGLRLGKGRKVNGELKQEESFIDVVAVSHEFTDHCHRVCILSYDAIYADSHEGYAS